MVEGGLLGHLGGDLVSTPGKAEYALHGGYGGLEEARLLVRDGRKDHVVGGGGECDRGEVAALKSVAAAGKRVRAAARVSRRK